MEIGPDPDWIPCTYGSCEHISGPFYHGTAVALEPGTLLGADSGHLGHPFRSKPITIPVFGDHCRSEATHVLVSSTRVIAFRSISWRVSGLLFA